MGNSDRGLGSARYAGPDRGSRPALRWLDIAASKFYGWRERYGKVVEGYVEHYNNVRLNSVIGYITPRDRLAGHQREIQAERDRKLEAAREQRKNHRERTA